MSVLELGKRRTSRRLLLSTVAIVSSMLPTVAATSQSAEHSTSPTTRAEISRLVHGFQAAGRQQVQQFAFRPQPLAQALRQFSNQTGIQIAYNSAELRGRTTKGFSGSYTPDAALGLLLSGSKVRHRYTYDDAVVVQVAQSAPGQATDGEISLDQIVVRGEVVERTVQESSTSTVVVTGEELDQSTSTDLYDVIERTPGVSASADDRTVTIRGINQIGPTRAGQGLLVNRVVDGASIAGNQNTFFGPYSTWDLGQIEILRGPQSTQQGRNALAGAIIIRTADPFHGTEYKLRQDFETLGGFRSAAAVNIPLVPDVLALRTAGEWYNSDGWVKNRTRGEDDYDPHRLRNFRAKALFTPSDRFEFIYGFNFTRNDGGDPSIEATSYPSRRLTFADLRSKIGGETEIHNLRSKINLTDVLTLLSETTFLNTSSVNLVSVDGLVSPGTFTNRTGDEQSFTQETKLAFETEYVKGAAGVYYTNINDETVTSAVLTGPQINALFPPALVVNSRSASDVSTENLAFFGEADIKIFDSGWTATLGARYDTEKFREVTNGTTVTNIPVPLPFPAAAFSSTSGKFSAFLPKFGLAYNWTPDIKTGVVVQRGYRAGGTFSDLVSGAVSNFDPEFTWNYEVYQRAVVLDGRLTINANAYYLDWRDQQVRQQTPNPLVPLVPFNTIVNAAQSYGVGGEISVKAQVTDAFDLFASYAYARNRFRSFVSNGVSLKGNKFAFSPEHTASFGGKYRFDQGVFIAADANYMSSQEGDPENSRNLRIEPRFLANAEVGYEGENWTASVFVRNLFDEDYRTGIVNVPRRRFFTGEPRVVGVKATAKF